MTPDTLRKICMADALDAHGIPGRRIDAPFPLWLVSTHEVDDDRLRSILSKEENERAAQFRFTHLSRRYRTAHAALRLLVAVHTGVRPDAQEFGADEFGKYRLLGQDSVQCNISYTGEHALVALNTSAEIGVDIEQIRPVEDAASLAQAHCTRQEQASLKRLSQEAYDRAFLAIWVRKEACSKALGKGLAIPLETYHCGVDTGRRNVLIDGEVVDSDVVSIDGRFLIAWSRRGPDRHAMDGASSR